MDLKGILESIGGAGNAVNTAAALGLGTAGLALAEKGYSDLGDIGEQAYAGLAGEGGLAEQLSGMLEFQPYTVTSATGGQFGMTQDPTTGQMTYQLATSPEEQAYQQSLFGGASQLAQQATAPYDPRYEELANQAYGGVGALMTQAQKAAIDAGSMDRGAREDQVYEQLRALQSPEEERQRLALEQRMAAQGRTGVRTAQFGGTPEQLAMAKAQAEALIQNIKRQWINVSVSTMSRNQKKKMGKKIYYTTAPKLHPNRGGNTQAFQVFSNAYDKFKTYVNQN